MSTETSEREALTDLEKLYPMWLEKAQVIARADLNRARQSLASLKNRQGAYFDGISAMCAARQRILDAWMDIGALSTPPAAVIHPWKDEPPDWCDPKQAEIWEMGYDAAMSSCLDANPAQAIQPTPCAGMSCGTTTAQHSPECIAEHAAAVAGGRFVKVPVTPRHQSDSTLPTERIAP